MQHDSHQVTLRHRDERGGVMLAVLTILMPIVLILGSLTTTMTARTARLGQDLADERALLAAESGVDQAIFESRRGNLFSGVPITRTVGAMLFVVTPTYLGNDGLNNDGDLLTDEADEDVFQIVSVGRYRNTTRRIAAYVGRVSFLPPVKFAFTSGNPGLNIVISGSPTLSGRNHHLDGTLVGSDDTYGIGVVAPATVASVLSVLSPSEQGRVDGIGGPPSVGPAPAFDLTSLVNNARNAATHLLTNGSYTSLPPGPSIYYRQGNLRLSGIISASGLLVVTGRLEMVGTIDFKGVIVALGDLDNSNGTMTVLGGLLTGPSSSTLAVRGTANIKYSTAGIDLANTATVGRYVAFNGWQELSRN